MANWGIWPMDRAINTTVVSANANASHAARDREQQKQSGGSERQLDLAAWSRFWREWIASIYFHAYRSAVAHAQIIPSDDAGIRALLTALILENAFIELRVQLEFPTPRLTIPLASILEVLERSRKQA